MKHIYLIVLFCLNSLATLAQISISGTVKDSDSREPIEGIVVTCIDSGNKIITYSITNTKGVYNIELSSKSENLKIAFDHISYDSHVENIVNKTAILNITLKAKSLSIKEVVVSAPALKLRGDTLSYSLGAFKGVADISLEDALKKLPGVNIEANGAIKYLGRNIDNFYIEDLDLLGGRYAIATRNIRADMVTSVELIENHQSVKMLENKEISNKIAVNIKLNKKAKIKPSGTIDGTLGYGDEGFLYRMGVTGMIFSPKFQTISTLKYGNIGNDDSKEQNVLTKEVEDPNNIPLSILGNISASKPPLNENRYSSIKNGLVSVNSINKFKNESLLRINLGYQYDHSNYIFDQISEYNVDENTEVVTEIISPLSIVHRPSLSVQYKVNEADKFIENHLWASGVIIENICPTINNSNTINQNRDAKAYDINNKFSYRKLHKGNILSFSSALSLAATPQNTISFTSANQKDINYIQNSEGEDLSLKNNFNYSFNISDYVSLFIPASLNIMYDNLVTKMIGAQIATNNIKGATINGSIMPRLEYVSPNKSLKAIFATSIGYSLLDYTQAKEVYNKLLMNENIDLNYTVSPTSKLKLRLNVGNSIGDVTDFLIAPIQLNYRTTSIKSGVLAENFNASTILSYDFKIPLSYIFINADLGYNYQKRNLLSSQTIEQSRVINSFVMSDNENSGITSRLLVSKLFKPIETKFNIGGNINYSTGSVMQQNIITKYQQLMYSFDGNIISRPWKWVELDYSLTIGWNDNKFKNDSNTFRFESHTGKIMFFPTPKIKIHSTLEYLNNEVADSKYIQMALLDAGVSYKFKRIELELVIKNILNNKSYGYTILSGLDSFSYNYNLRGREILLKIKFF